MERAKLSHASQSEINHDHNGWLEKLEERGKKLGQIAMLSILIVLAVTILVFMMTDRSFAVAFAIATSAGTFAGTLSFFLGLAIVFADD